MGSYNDFGKLLIIFGIAIILVGLIFLVLEKLPSYSFRFPGDILIKRKNFVFYFPVGLSIILSLLFSLLLKILNK